MHIALGNEITPAKAYSSLVLLSLFSYLLNGFGSIGITVIYLILTSFKRFTQILLLEEKPEISYQDCSEHSLIVNNCKFSWSLPENHTEEAGDHSPLMENPKIWTLNNINFSIKPRELIIVIGSVGSGKTALFLGILKELCILDGSIAKHGDIAYVSEEPWIISGTIKENILMGADYKEDWYNKVIKSCSLERDFDLFKEYRDETMVGDRGITLSGGQKARISLARAVYSNRELTLLDDPLSAVDPEVCNSLFTQCIKGILGSKSVILATHQTHFVSHADKILILDGGNQVFFGTYEELQDSGYTRYLGKSNINSGRKHRDIEINNEELPEETKIAVRDIQSILEEEKAHGVVPRNVYWKYLMLAYYSWFFFASVVLFEAISQISSLAVIFWVSYWADAGDQDETRYFIVMLILVILVYLLAFTRHCFIQFPLINSAQRLHDLALSGIVFTKSVFFDKNPAGRMINRFSKDTT